MSVDYNPESDALIPLTWNRTSIVDKEDAERVLEHKWCAHFADGDGSRCYAITNIYDETDGRRHTIRLHGFVLQAMSSDIGIDHRNGDTLDNRKSNLRFASPSGNRANARAQFGTSQYKGVSFHRLTGKWRAYIKVDSKAWHLGLFDDEVSAARAYDDAARECFGDFARVNFPRIGELSALMGQ